MCHSADRNFVDGPSARGPPGVHPFVHRPGFPPLSSFQNFGASQIVALQQIGRGELSSSFNLNLSKIRFAAFASRHLAGD